MLDYIGLALTIFSTIIGILGYIKTVPEKGERSKNPPGIPTLRLWARTLARKYPRAVFFLPAALFAGIKIPDVAIFGSALIVVYLFLKSTPSKKTDIILDGAIFVAAACLGVWLGNNTIVGVYITEFPIF